MSAHVGNRFAEKWTYQSTMKALERISFFAMQEDTLYLGMALARAGYYDDIWRYWRRKWARHFEIIHEMNQLMQHFEARIYGQTAKGKIPLRLGIFTLQHHYGWGREKHNDDDLGYLAEADLGQTADPVQPLPEGEAAHTISDAEASQVDGAEPTSAELPESKAEKPSAKAAQKRYPIELTPEELLLETGISDIKEIERRMREDDPELAEFDDMDEDLEWEVVTPETYKP